MLGAYASAAQANDPTSLPAQTVGELTAGGLVRADSNSRLSTSAADITGTPGYMPPAARTAPLILNVPSQFPTIAAALAATQNLVISPAIPVTIRVAAGTYTATSPTALAHPAGANINIFGAPPMAISVTSVGTVSGSAGAWSVPLTLGTTAASLGITAGQVVKLSSASGGTAQIILGAWLITAVSGSTVTVANTNHIGTFPDVSGATASGRCCPRSSSSTARRGSSPTATPA